MLKSKTTKILHILEILELLTNILSEKLQATEGEQNIKISAVMGVGGVCS